MPYYESVLIARQEIGNAEAEQLGERYEALLGEQGATVVRKEYWGLRKLAYRVRKNRKGHYLMFHVDGPGAAIQELERQLRIDEDVIRYLSMRIDAIPEEPSVIMRARAEREERREQEAAQREGKEDGKKEQDDDGKAEAKDGGESPAAGEDAGAKGGDDAKEAEEAGDAEAKDEAGAQEDGDAEAGEPTEAATDGTDDAGEDAEERKDPEGEKDS